VTDDLDALDRALELHFEEELDSAIAFADEPPTKVETTLAVTPPAVAPACPTCAKISLPRGG